MKGYVLDASALLAFLHREIGHDIVQRALPGATISAVNWSEVVQKSLAYGATIQANRARLEALGLAIVPFDAQQAEDAGQLWPVTKPHGLSLADRACLALAKGLDAPVLTTDKSWSRLDIALTITQIR